MAMVLEALSCARIAFVIAVMVTTISASASEAAPGEAVTQYPCQGHVQDITQVYPFCDKRLPIDERVRDFVSHLSLEEKEKLLVNTNSETTSVGLPAYEWWGEALHGVAKSPAVHFGKGPIKGATSFPQPILTAASFNKMLFKKIAQVISTEARAMYNENQAGLTYWAPNINIFRDPRWGRGQETPGEDPYLTSIYAEYFVRGMQEDEFEDMHGRQNSSVKASDKDPEKLKVSACCKHFTAYDLDQWYKVDRFDFDAKVTKQDLLDTYNPPFQSCVEKGKASALMCSYNRINGVPSCADYSFLTELVRGTWGFDGYIVSDCDAVQVMYANSKFAENPQQAIAYALQAGMDLNCGDTASKFTLEAVKEGLLDISFIDAALQNSFKVLFRLGYFDGNPEDPESSKYGKLDRNDVCKQEHQDLALEAAVQGIVLLKNDKDTLPFSRLNIRKLAVLGPNADDTIATMLGNYAGEPCNYFTPYKALASYVETTTYHPGCVNGTFCDGNNWIEYIQRASEMAVEADAVILVMGLGQVQERESFDRTSLRLPGKQEELVKTISRVARGPVILILMNGGPLDINFAKYDSRIKSILWIGYPGQAGGEALAQIIFGERNPGGKLPVSWYPEFYTRIPMTEMSMRPDIHIGYPGRSYRFYTGEPIYKFGDGLSYTKFTFLFESAPLTLISSSKSRLFCSWLLERRNPTSTSTTKMTSDADHIPFDENMEIEFEVRVKNEGPVFGSSVMLLYHAHPYAGLFGKPIKQLVGFERVDLESMEEQKVVFKVDLCRQLSFAGVDGTWFFPEEGMHTFSLGDYEVTHPMQITYAKN
ncbi:hypothetical protein R1sor_003725 [Riccia sorocarpa]|uniref:Fibronectin type III-like domain-containing protein n=1 Tax=Riccia sorocarpa TaxID=122646 RepID=A0ABD3H382_9MARC